MILIVSFIIATVIFYFWSEKDRKKKMQIYFQELEDTIVKAITRSEYIDSKWIDNLPICEDDNQRQAKRIQTEKDIEDLYYTLKEERN